MNEGMSRAGNKRRKWLSWLTEFRQPKGKVHGRVLLVAKWPSGGEQGVSGERRDDRKSKTVVQKSLDLRNCSQQQLLSSLEAVGVLRAATRWAVVELAKLGCTSKRSETYTAITDE